MLTRQFKAIDKKRGEAESRNFQDFYRDIHICRVLQTIQMKLILLCVMAETAVLASTKTALKFKYEI